MFRRAFGYSCGIFTTRIPHEHRWLDSGVRGLVLTTICRDYKKITTRWDSPMTTTRSTLLKRPMYHLRLPLHSEAGDSVTWWDGSTAGRLLLVHYLHEQTFENVLLLSATTDYRPQGLPVLRGICHDLLDHSPVLDQLIQEFLFRAPLKFRFSRSSVRSEIRYLCCY
ncbi:hypothetical protein OH76DRAFT_717163 [Lentinus brumalis]|uniref:Uncharacterized protein n=1 Tax=Lentinus brumalis TaxID=2498619 RepID=A0A371D5K5_9APHY|nr:hypothetical protein OH76DRAFT_717163 [Polyporus brumalis]